MNQFYVIDKPLGFTSFDVLRVLKKKIGIKKMWHTGTLDPLATGLLLVAVGDYTKLIPYFEKDIKTYEFEISLNGVSPSFDSETEISYISQEQQLYYQQHLTKDDIQLVLSNNFTWRIHQIPPKYSALKIGGKKALDLVRTGHEFEMKGRDVEIFSIKILNYSYPFLRLEATVSAGTYIRSIAHDLWEILWTWGFITFLRRTQIWEISQIFAQELETFDAEKSMDIRKMFQKKQFIELSDDILKDINNGKIVNYEVNGEEWEEIFIHNSEKITNIVKKSGLNIIPIRKI